MARMKYYNNNNKTWEYADEKLSISPVQSVNGKHGAVELTASDVGAEASGAVALHNNDKSAHPDIREMISGLENQLINNSELEKKFVLKSDISTKSVLLTLEDGSTVLIDVVVASEGTTITKYINRIPESIDTDKTIFGEDYNGDGVKDGYQKNLRLSSSGATKPQTDGYPYITGFIPVQAGDEVRIAGIQWYVPSNGLNYIWVYDENFNPIGGVLPSKTYYGDFITSNPSMECSEELTLITLPTNLTDIAYIRVNWVGTDGTAYDPKQAIITVNQEITD